jgi:hypothetical protein
MSWLEELEYTFLYMCPEGHETRYTTGKQPSRDSQMVCKECGALANYQGPEPKVMGLTTAVDGEKNGVKFVEYKDGKGNIRRISKTKLEYLRTGKTDRVLADDYKKHLERAQVSQAEKVALKE